MTHWTNDIDSPIQSTTVSARRMIDAARSHINEQSKLPSSPSSPSPPSLSQKKKLHQKIMKMKNNRKTN